MVERICGTPKDKFLKVCEMIAETLGARQDDDVDVRARLDAALARARRTSAPWRCCSCILGNIGVRGGGMNALRGHSNIQGLTDLGPDVEPAPRLPDAADGEGADFDTYMSTRGFKPLRPTR